MQNQPSLQRARRTTSFIWALDVRTTFFSIHVLQSRWKFTGGLMLNVFQKASSLNILWILSHANVHCNYSPCQHEVFNLNFFPIILMKYPNEWALSSIKTTYILPRSFILYFNHSNPIHHLLDKKTCNNQNSIL